MHWGKASWSWKRPCPTMQLGRRDRIPQSHGAGGRPHPTMHWGRRESPWNIMIKHRLVQRRGRRSQMMTSFTDPVVSMDLLRAVLQPTINDEIQAVFGKYMKFFQKAAGNVRENVGEDVDMEQLIHETCRNCLEQAKLLFCDDKKSVARLPHEVPTMKRTKPVEEEVNRQGSPLPKKRKGRPPGQSQLSDPKPVGGSTGKNKSCEPVPRDGPKWDPARIKDSTPLVLGSRANKALGMGGTRGRLYIKHPHMFKYAADPQDKHWLAEQQHMRATGGKMAYLLLEEDIRDLAASEEYRGSPELKLDELKPFTPPPWMTVKMRKYMETLRNEGEQHPPQSVPPPPQEGAPKT
ncbi:deoxynucleotidyltransferase terminal-interacting protein 1 isoform X2 [Sceloporus undulatus]|uniref:deoxynucleotidyltransferase terminal-interacting protein 1 isoform X2 n=1 Tax=Sceloporus undulatus TaxID=8520 RepID=UPI001C4B2D3D|nr:deoxynucleotidyltransferase terminal-interacting protein 1 isoform X2 [Sceloporus undulatus]